MLQQLAQSASVRNYNLARPLSSGAPGLRSQGHSKIPVGNHFAVRYNWRETFTLIAFLILLGIPVQGYSLEIALEGVPKEFRPSVRATLETPEGDSQEEIADFISLVPERARLALQSEGYYNSDVKIRQEADTLFVTVALGPPVKISRLIIQVEGEGRADPGYIPVIADIPLRQNAVFRHEDYEKAKDVLFDRAQDRGYFDLEFTKNEVRVSRKNNTAEITLHIETDIRYTFATVEFKTDYFPDTFLRGYVPFEYGDFYESSKIAALTRQLQDTGFFSNVKVIPIRSKLTGAQVPVRVEVSKKDKNQLAFGLGFATDTEGRGTITWNRPLVNKSGHSLEAELGVSAINQNLSFQYRLPRSKDPLHNFWSLEAGLLNEEVEEQRSFLSTFNVQRIRKTKRDWTESLFVRWEREFFQLGEQSDRINLLLPGFSYSKNKSEGFPFATRGYSVQAQVFLGTRFLFSGIDLYKAELNLKYLKSVSKNDTFILAAQYGAISSDDFSRVPTSQRFFVGGDRTIRGFPFRTLSPTDSNGDAIGGRYKEVLTLEYNRRFKSVWAVALFADAGRAFDEFDAPYNVGAGFGIRWLSPVGPFRVDFAFGVSEDDVPFQLHLSLGPEL